MNNSVHSLLSILNLQQPYSAFQPSLQLQPSYQELISLTINLQNTVMKQQAVIQNLMYRLNTQPDPIQMAQPQALPTHCMIKLENTSIGAQSEDKNEEANSESQHSLYTPEEHVAPDHAVENNKEVEGPKIKRRFGFKRTRKARGKLGENENSSPDGQTEKMPKSSKAKHLWVNYGRRIIEYAISQTQGTTQDRIRQLSGKMSSKKDFERAFQITPEDTQEDKLFKTLFGRLAITFVKYKAAATFTSSTYKDQMFSQRHVVAAWIERLIEG